MGQFVRTKLETKFKFERHILIFLKKNNKKLNYISYTIVFQ
jgi:hypothetical protein